MKKPIKQSSKLTNSKITVYSELSNMYVSHHGLFSILDELLFDVISTTEEKIYDRKVQKV